MATPRTTLILILLAGDDLTTAGMDGLLYEIQSGRNGRSAVDPPQIFCLYHRLLPTGAVAHHYAIDENTLTFIDRKLDLSVYPPHGATPLTGTIETKVTQFLRHVRAHLPNDGPVRFIVGAHGLPGLGFNPFLVTQLIELLKKLLDRLGSSQKDSKLRDEGELHIELLSTPGTTPSGFKSSPNTPLPELTLNHAGHELLQFPQDRLQTLILHNCDMSGLEAMSALSAAPHHIACETALSSIMRFHDWFSVLTDPRASEKKITKSCFRSLRSACKPNALGTFSSHRTGEICSILRDLDALGEWLDHFYSQGDPTVVTRRIKKARGAGSVSSLTIDIVAFCMNLKRTCGTPSALTAPIVAAILRNQVEPPVKISSWLTADFADYQGISVYFPEQGIGADLTAALPASFQLVAPHWCLFIDRWLRAR